MYAEATLIGRLGRDPEVKTFWNTKICSMTIAVSGKKETTHWFNLKAFGETGERYSTWFKKGSLVMVRGTPETFKYKSKAGLDVSGVEFSVSYMRNLETKGAKQEPTTASINKEFAAAGLTDKPVDFDEDSIPF
jgi:single-strand DNA-binding protein